jgi:hypothetical protein
VIRESYPNIEANILKSWFNIVPEEEGKFNWRAPYVHTFSKVLRRDKDGAADRHPRHGSRVPRDRRQERRGSHPRLGNQRRLDRRIRPAAARADQLPVGPRRALLQPRAELVVDPQIIVTLNMPYIDNHAYGLLLERNLGELDPDKNPELARRSRDGR